MGNTMSHENALDDQGASQETEGDTVSDKGVFRWYLSWFSQHLVAAIPPDLLAEYLDYADLATDFRVSITALVQDDDQREEVEITVFLNVDRMEDGQAIDDYGDSSESDDSLN